MKNTIELNDRDSSIVSLREIKVAWKSEDQQTEWIPGHLEGCGIFWAGRWIEGYAKPVGEVGYIIQADLGPKVKHWFYYSSRDLRDKDFDAIKEAMK